MFLPWVWAELDNNAQMDFLLSQGVLTPQQDSRRSPTTRVLEAIQQAGSKTITAAPLAALTHLETPRVSHIVSELKKHKRIKEVRKREYSAGTGEHA